MKTNSKTRILTPKIVLVPYRKEHVPKYHEWMQSPELQELTASEPLSLEEEYDMQQSWLIDEDKCTFIVLDTAKLNETHDEIQSMVGDVNLFFNDQEDKCTAEVEVMIAEPDARGKGFGKETVTAMMFYGMHVLSVKRYTAKIGLSNTKSINMFQKFGFQEQSRSDYFKEVTLEFPITDSVKTTLENAAEQFRIETSSENDT